MIFNSAISKDDGVYGIKVVFVKTQKYVKVRNRGRFWPKNGQ